MANLKTSLGAIFIQLNGSNTQPQFVGCVDMDTLTEPGGEIDTLIRCLKVDGSGWTVKGATVKTVDTVTTSLTTYVESIQSALDLIQGSQANLFVHEREDGRANVFLNYVRSWAFQNIQVGGKTASDLVNKDTDTPGMAAYPISARPPVYRILQKDITRQSITETSALTCIVFCDVDCTTGFIGCEAGSGATADVLYTSNGGTTWTATATDPFSTNERIASIACFLAIRNINRVMVALGTARASNPMAIAYSDNAGATWTSVDVGSVNGQYAKNHNSLFAYSPYHIWLVCGAGYIYKSIDQGMNWTAQESGATTTSSLYAVYFISETTGVVVGASGAVLVTMDGGFTWTLRTAPTAGSLNTVCMIDQEHIWTGGSNGILYYSTDGGVTWNTRLFSGSGNGDIRTIKFTGLLGYMVVNYTVGAVYTTIDGGYTWELQGAPTNTGLNDVFICAANNVWVAGKVTTGTGVLLSMQPGISGLSLPSTASAYAPSFNFSDSRNSMYLPLI